MFARLPLTALGIGALFGAATLAGPALAQAAAEASDGWEVIATIPGSDGTDIEFTSRELTTWKNPDGKLVELAVPATRHFAVVGNQREGANIVDITTPDAPYVVSQIPCSLSQGDPQISPDGMIAAIGGQGSGDCSYRDASGEEMAYQAGSALIDLSNIYEPVVVGNAVNSSGGSHNNTIHPSGDYLYISSSSIGQTTNIPIFDISDPTNPIEVARYTDLGSSPHDVRFSADGTRAYLAAVTDIKILDTSDPTDPSLIAIFKSPGEEIVHDTLLSPDGNFLFVGDEAGGGAPYACPGGAIHVWDITEETVPVYLGQTYAGVGPVTNRPVDAPAAGTVTSCTSHVMELNPNGTSLTIGWYGGGTRVFDFSDLTQGPTPVFGYGENGVGLVETGHIVPDGASTWSAKQYAPLAGYIFADDLNLGFYVVKTPDAIELDIAAPQPLSAGGSSAQASEPELTPALAVPAATNSLPATGGGLALVGLLALMAGAVRRQ
ncbi:MAG: hypothetical protein ACI867_001640 [Glaciecola sp.]|jgi:hypothetical protein